MPPKIKSRSGYSGRKGTFPDSAMVANVPFYNVNGECYLPIPFGAVDQGQVPCCVSCAIAKCMESLDAASPPSVQLSPMSHYLICGAKQDGLDLSEGIVAATASGICTESFYPSVFTTPPPQPPSDLRDSAAACRLRGWDTVLQRSFTRQVLSADRVSEWRNELLQYHTVVAGIRVTRDYFRLDKSAPNPIGDAILPANSSPPYVEFHAVAVLGFKDSENNAGYFKIADSRGTNFGNQGIWWLPYEMVNGPDIIDSWILAGIKYDT